MTVVSRLARTRLLGLLGLGLLLIACGGETAATTTAPTEAGGTGTTTAEGLPGSLDGELIEFEVPVEGLAVADALDEAAGPVVVYGQLFDDGDGLRLCGGLTRALPPACVGEPLWIDGLDTTGLAFEVDDATRWSEDAIVLEGILDGDTLRDARVR
ncbi:MAG: hypothetical protein WEE36_08240 [Acidimicrobiia bacterium]